MTTRVLSAPARTRPGATLLLDDAPHLVLHLLPRLPGRALAARLTADPPCRLCEAPLQWAPPARRWECPECADVPTTEQLADWAREHVRDGVRAGRARRGRGRGTRNRQVARGAPGAAAVLLRAAADGGALSRAYLVDLASGAERRALAWALRDDGDRPLPAARCREAAAALASVTPASIEAPAARHNLADRRTADPGDPHGGDL